MKSSYRLPLVVNFAALALLAVLVGISTLTREEADPVDEATRHFDRVAVAAADAEYRASYSVLHPGSMPLSLISARDRFGNTRVDLINAEGPGHVWSIVLTGSERIICENTASVRPGRCRPHGLREQDEPYTAAARQITVLDEQRRSIGGYGVTCFQLAATASDGWEECYTEDGVLAYANGTSVHQIIQQFFPSKTTPSASWSMVISEVDRSVEDEELAPPFPD